MGKVKLTKKQAEAVEIRKGMNMFEESVKCHIEGKFKGETNKALAELSLDEFVRALYIGYEVEETFEVGDWVEDVEGSVGQITEVKGLVLWVDWGGPVQWIDKKEAVHAMPEKITKEKQRRWWAEHGRGIWELKLNDELSHRDSDQRYDVVHVFDNGDINIERTCANNFKQKEVMTVKRSYISNYYYEVVCFAEDRKDVDHD